MFQLKKMIKQNLKECVGIPLFSIEDLAKTNDSKKQLIKAAIAIKLPKLCSVKNHYKIIREAIKELKLDINRFENNMDNYFKQSKSE